MDAIQLKQFRNTLCPFALFLSQTGILCIAFTAVNDW